MSRRADGPVLAVAGLSREARIAAGAGIETIQAGGRPAALREALRALRSRPFRAVVSFGIAGGLDPALAPGDLVLGAGVTAIGEAGNETGKRTGRRYACDPAIAAAHAARLAEPLAAQGARVVTAELAGAEAAILTLAEKAALHARTGAAAVDMESHVAAAFAAENGLPFAILRVVCDPSERALPAFAASALKPNGDPDVLAVLAALARGRARPGELLQLARDSGAAFRRLSRARALLGLALGVDP